MSTWWKGAVTIILLLLLPAYVAVVQSLPVAMESTCSDEMTPEEIASTLEDRGNDLFPAETREDILESHNTVHSYYLQDGAEGWSKEDLGMEHARLKHIMEREGVNHTRLHQVLNERDERYPLQLSAGGGQDSAGFCSQIGMNVIRSYYFGTIQLPVYRAGINLDTANRLFIPLIVLIILGLWLV